MSTAKTPAATHVLITGATAGIGRTTALDLAAKGYHVIATGRRVAELDKLKAEAPAGSRLDVTALDVTSAASIADAAREVDRLTGGHGLDVLVNNAGFGHFRRFVDVEPARDDELIALNVGAVVALCHHFAAAHRDRSPTAPTAYVLNVASVAAWQALPHFATYAASKVFVRSLSEALHVELRPHRIVVTCLCPGGTHSEFHALAGAGNYSRLANASMLTAADVAERGVRAMLRGKRTVVTGRLNRISTFLTGLAPRGVATWAASRVLGRPRAEPLPARTGASAASTSTASPSPESPGAP